MCAKARPVRVCGRRGWSGPDLWAALEEEADRLGVSAAHYIRDAALTRLAHTRGLIADKSQRGWVMNGMPIARATSPGGRWVYTLYQNPGGYPFVHALDTVRGVAHCIGIPWHGKQNALWQLRMSLRDGGRTLSLHWRGGREYLAVARGTWRISHPAATRHDGSAGSSGFPWWIVGVAGGVVLLVAATALFKRRGYALPGPARAPQA